MKWTHEEITLLQKYYGKIPINDLQKNFLSNKTLDALRLKASRLNIKCLERPTIYHHKKDFFSNINIDNSYWAGFIAADGSIKQDQRVLRLSLSKKDRTHLKKFRKIIKTNNLIRDYSQINKITSKYTFNSVIYISAAKQLCLDLATYFNIVPNKTFILKPPNLMNERYIANFIRGYMDGDGTIYYNKSRKTWLVKFVGNKDMLDWIKFHIRRHVPLACNPAIGRNENIYSLVFDGNIQARAILDWLYQDSNILTRLNRKYNKYQDSCRVLKKTG